MERLGFSIRKELRSYLSPLAYVATQRQLNRTNIVRSENLAKLTMPDSTRN